MGENIVTALQSSESEPGNSPVTAGHPAAWDEAFVRVESYLRAHHLESRVLLNRLANEIIDEARVLAAQEPGENPVVLAMEIAHARIASWFVRLFREGDWCDERFRARGRLALVMADMPGRWSQHFLSDEEVPRDFVEAMTSSTLQPGPELRFSNMPPAPLEFAFDDAEEQLRKTFNGRTFLRAAASWLVIAGLLGAAWMTTH